MKPHSVYAAGAMLLLGILAPTPNAAQSQGLDFDPARPFAKVGAPAEWVNRFRSGKPEIDPNDRFRNLTSREWVDSWTKRI